jgi:hypothetical protein
MLQVLADENFNGDVIRGLMLRTSNLDVVRVQDVGLAGADDPTILEWAAENNRILLTHDRATMTRYADERLFARQRMVGVFIVSDRLSVGKAIDEILVLAECSEQAEWDALIVHLPL